MNHLSRERAPISAAGWSEIEKEAKRTLMSVLAARRLVDFVGPAGWTKAAVETGASTPIEAPPGGGVEARLRQALPLVELRAPFEVRRRDLEAIDRGSKDADTGPVIEAARRIALAEDRAVFHGYAAAEIGGMCAAREGAAVTFSEDYALYPASVATALNRLRDEGVDGPYALALGESCYTGLTESTVGGYPVMEHVRRLIDGPIVWAPAVDGAVLMSQRGEDFELTVGQDFSIGYLSHDAETVRLYIEESFTFRVLSPQAAVPLTRRPAEIPAAPATGP